MKKHCLLPLETRFCSSLCWMKIEFQSTAVVATVSNNLCVSDNWLMLSTILRWLFEFIMLCCIFLKVSFFSNVLVSHSLTSNFFFKFLRNSFFFEIYINFIQPWSGKAKRYNGQLSVKLCLGKKRIYWLYSSNIDLGFVVLATEKSFIPLGFFSEMTRFAFHGFLPQSRVRLIVYQAPSPWLTIWCQKLIFL